MQLRNADSLRREIRQTRRFRSDAQEAVLTVLRTADVIRRRLAGVLGPAGLSFEQYNVLRILRGAGTDGLATLEIAERMIERTPAMTRLLDKLEAKKLAWRERPAEDRRRILCHITAAGLRLLRRLDRPVDAADAAAVAMLGRGDRRRLVRLLDRMRSR